MAATGFAATPTFSKDVAPILFEHCATCHRAGEIGPMPLLTYNQVRPWAKAIRNAVALGKMPPWPATQPRGVFSNDRRLSDHDRETLLAWAAGGAPQGDPKDLPATPEFSEGWKIGKPDVVLTMPAAFKVPAWGADAYQYIKVPTNFTEDKWVQSIEVRPGARRVVHHALVIYRPPGEGTTWEDAFHPVGSGYAAHYRQASMALITGSTFQVPMPRGFRRARRSRLKPAPSSPWDCTTTPTASRLKTSPVSAWSSRRNRRAVKCTTATLRTRNSCCTRAIGT